jgi:hypothetical protein
MVTSQLSNAEVAKNDIAFLVSASKTVSPTLPPAPFFPQPLFLCAPAVLSQQKLPAQGDKLHINN